MTAEELAIALDNIRRGDGVIDVSHCMGVGKKGRSLTMVCIMFESAFESAVCELCFRETTTLGMRVQCTTRRVLRRSVQQVSDEDEVAQIKIAERPAGDTAKVESDDLAELPGLRARRMKAQRLLNKVNL